MAPPAARRTTSRSRTSASHATAADTYAADPSVRRAGIYVRISDDAEGEAKGVARQEKDCRELAARHGWEIVSVYLENDTSAYKRKKVRLPDGTTALRVIRPAFRQMLHDAQAGAITAIVGYDLDRVARDPRDLEDLIDIVEQQQIPTRAVTGSLDLSNDAGITMARVMVAIANKSSRDTGRRVARKHQQLAEEGRYGGGGIRSYGYSRDGLTIVEEEAAVLRDVARRILGGESLTSIAKLLTAEEVLTVRDARFPNGARKGWSSRSVHSVITKPRIAGVRAYKGEILGDATWPAILTRETWEQICMALDERAGGNTNRLRYWLSGVLICGLCRTPLRGNTAVRGGASEDQLKLGRYWCAPGSGGCGRIGITGTVATTAREVIVGYLSRPDVLEALQDATSTDATSAVRRELHQDEKQLRELAELYAHRGITMKEYVAARRIVEKRMEGRKRILQATLPRAVVEVLNATNAGETFDGLDPHQKREVARLVFPGGVFILPARNRSRYEPERFVPAYSLDDDPRRALKRLMHDFTGKIQ